MSFREKLKQSVKDFKADTKASLKRKGEDLDEDSTRPTTPSGSKSQRTGQMVARAVADSAVGIVEFGPLKHLSDMIQGFADMYIMDGEVKKEYVALQQRLEKMLEILEEHPDKEMSPAIKGKVQGIRDFIEGELNSMGIKQVTGSCRRVFMAKEQEERFIACCQRTQCHMDKLLVGTSLSMWKMEERLSQDQIGRLPFAPSACYNSRAGEELKRRECTPGTRIDVLATLLAWTRNNTNTGVYWLNGMAGTGKTTIAYSVCKELDAGRNLAASFFCSRLREECRDVNMIIPSISYQLARLSHSFQSALSTVIDKDPDVHTRRLDLQFEALIEEPLLSAKPTLPEGLVVAIDALDECDNKDSTRDILRVLLTKATNLPIKFVVSSRPEPQIRDHMIQEQLSSRLVLHELDTGNVQADIKTYLQDELKSMKPPPTDSQIATLVEKAGILFIYAATTVRYIGHDNFRRNPSARLCTILEGSQGRKSAESRGIDQLYTMILDAAFGDEELEDAERADMQQVLHTVICAREPLTIDSLSELLHMNDPDRVQAALCPLWSVVHVVTGSELVTTLHASFPDYMFNPSRSKTHWCESKTQNSGLAERCFEILQQTDPRLNILGLESSYLPDEDVKGIQERVAREIPDELLYACRYWGDHVGAGDCASSVIEKLRVFLSNRLLVWMEVLNLHKQMAVGMECVKLVVNWCQAFKVEQELVELTEDAKRFVDAFASNPVSRSTPHIYVSMLAFWPPSSPIAKHYAKYTQGPVQPEGTALGRRQSAHLSTWSFENQTTVMDISPDGLLLALEIGWDLVVIDSSSGAKLLGPLELHNYLDHVGLVAFSPEGSRIYTGSATYEYLTIRVRDTHSGNLVLGPLELCGNTGPITCLSISPDRTRIATGGSGQAVQLWDIESGREVFFLVTEAGGSVDEREESDPEDVICIAFSPDGTRILAGLSDSPWHVGDIRSKDPNLAPLTGLNAVSKATFSSDGSRIIGYGWTEIYVFDAQSGENILGPIEGHTAGITCIGCSPDGRYIVSSAQDRTVRVWDVQNGKMVLGPLEAHTTYITSAVFTPDGRRIISACRDGFVSTWDAQQRNQKPSSSNAAFHPITRAKFSSDGTRFVSGSVEGTISIWDAQTGEMRVGPIEAHTGHIWAVDFLNDLVVSGSSDGTISICDALSGEVVLSQLQLGIRAIGVITYSPDGQMIATGSESGVNVWNAQNGNRVLGPLDDLGEDVASVRFSPDGARIVVNSSSCGPSLAVWDVSTGQNLFGALKGHTGGVLSVSYSPDGALIASAAYDKTIIVWDAYTGKKRLDPLIGHSSGINSVHFSPDSTRLVSGSFDRTIQIWDVRTGGMLFKLSNGHEDWIRSVEYSRDGTRILSFSDDKSVRIHDARSPAERALSRLELEVGDWTMNRDGWVVDAQSRLLVWVPGDLRKALMWPRTQVMVAPHGYIRLKFDKSRLGESWMKGFTSCM